MKTKLSDLIAALPQEDDEAEVLRSDEAQERLKAIFADLAYRPVPTGSLHRLCTLGGLSAQVTLAYAALWFRHFFADAATNERLAMETNLRVALKMTHRLGYLRGAATKLGQLLGSLPEILPDQVVSTLDSLHFQAPPMHFSLLREMVRNELGKDPSELFATFDKTPFAAASIGQVHRATLKSGERNHGDPHSGNFVFMNDGRLGLLDFGCVQHFNTQEREQFARTDRFVEDPATLPELLRGGGFATEADLANEDYMQLMGQLWSWCVEPSRYEGAFDFGDASYLRRGIELTRDVVLKRYAVSAPMYVYLSRSMFGLAALLLRLRARVDGRSIHRKEFAKRVNS